MDRNHYKVLGLMSGTSLDGLDIAYCIFEEIEGKWNFSIEAALTYDYPEEWRKKLTDVHDLSAEGLRALDIRYGKWIGEKANQFLASHQLNPPDLIGSHGHTVFHKPNESYTLQIGEGACIAAATSCKVISDFRTQDVVLGGQGAPLVPIGDDKLFGSWDACMNLGGFANVSYRENKKRIAFDICPANIILNPIANQLGMAYDKAGLRARKGKLIPAMLETLNQLPFYNKAAPKSLGWEWVKKYIHPILDKYDCSEEDMLHTLCEHIAMQIGKSLEGIAHVLVTGGGVWNTYLMERIRANTSAEIVVPDKKVVDYKESLIFGLLAVLRGRNEVNCLHSVTGAIKDHSSGIVHYI
jgi:anhydro-N-acetylmuramic acid kinase